MKEYKKYDFCTSIGCIGCQWDRDKKRIDCSAPPAACIFTAKEFHKWLQENGFKIVKNECSKCN